MKNVQKHSGAKCKVLSTGPFRTLNVKVPEPTL
jgi:hypothetical protein